MKLQKGDELLITAGKDKGKRGKLERVFPQVGKVLVSGMNVYKKHVKDTSERTKTGGVVTIARPLPVGNVALVCKKCTEVTRVGYKLINGKKVRVCRKCGQEL